MIENESIKIIFNIAIINEGRENEGSGNGTHSHFGDDFHAIIAIIA